MLLLLLSSDSFHLASTSTNLHNHLCPFCLEFLRTCLMSLQEFIDIVEVVYRGARKGRGLVVSPKDYSTKYRY